MTGFMWKTAAAAALMVAAMPAQAAFTLATTNGGDGFVQILGTPLQFHLFSADNMVEIVTPEDTFRNSLTTYGEIAEADATISGGFRYYSNDRDGASFDPAGYFINGELFQFSDNNLLRGDLQFGSYSFTVNAGDAYGFYVDSNDTQLGRGVLTIGAVPEPASWAMLIAGFGLTGAAMRRRRAVVSA